MSSLEKQFDQAMMDIYYRAKSECNYVPSIFFNMLNQQRGVLTAKQLINATNVSDGYTKLYELERLDLTVEAVTYENAKWHELFTSEEIERCRKRLADYRYQFQA
jgi:hypothetical protein